MLLVVNNVYQIRSNIERRSSSRRRDVLEQDNSVRENMSDDEIE